MAQTSVRNVSYLCSTCKTQRTLSIDKDLHLQRREISINGLASYIDLHKSDKVPMHGMKLSIDANFHIRTNNELVFQEKSNSPIPLPGLKLKEINTKHQWKSWIKLVLQTSGSSHKFVLENERGGEEGKIVKREYKSPVKTVTCEIYHSEEQVENSQATTTGEWIEKFIALLELIPDLHIDLVPEVLAFIDDNGDQEPTVEDDTVISVLLDRSAILIPYHKSMKTLAKYGPALEIPYIDSENLSKVAHILSERESVKMSEIQSILSDVMKKGAELEEEVIVKSLAYLISFEMFDIKVSFVEEV